jgi:leader peptidase (prepilin peptidase)/N-methyltransferase
MVVVSFFFGTFAALFLCIPMFLFRRRQEKVAVAQGGIDESRYIPFGPGLAVGTVITMLTWKSVGPRFQFVFFEWFTLIVGVVLMGGGMFIASLLLGRRTKEPAAAA